MPREKVYKDMLGKEIFVGDEVLHLWLKIDGDGFPQCGKAGVKHKFATVIKICPNSVRLLHHDLNESESNVFTTTNRIIVINNKELIINKESIVNESIAAHEKELKRIKSINRIMQEDLDKEREKYKKMRSIGEKKSTDMQMSILDVKEENRDLKEAIGLLTKGSERFRNLDL